MRREQELRGYYSELNSRVNAELHVIVFATPSKCVSTRVSVLVQDGDVAYVKLITQVRLRGCGVDLISLEPNGRIKAYSAAACGISARLDILRELEKQLY